MKGTKTDCAHYIGTTGYPCKALRGLYCVGGGECNFYKTQEQFDADKAEAERRYKARTGQTAAQWLANKQEQERVEAEERKRMQKKEQAERARKRIAKAKADE